MREIIKHLNSGNQEQVIFFVGGMSIFCNILISSESIKEFILSPSYYINWLFVWQRIDMYSYELGILFLSIFLYFSYILIQVMIPYYFS